MEKKIEKKEIVKKEESEEKTGAVEEEKTEKKVVLPGDEIIKSMDYLPGRNCFREGEVIYSKKIGVVYYKGRVIEVVPLSGIYMPQVGDMVIGRVEDFSHAGWKIDINCPYEAFLPLAGVRGFIEPSKTDISKIYDVGDVLYTKITEVSPQKNIRVTMKHPNARKFREGRVVKISSVKVPRLIGKNGSMINTIKEKTGCRISVGQNGFVWLQGEKEDLAVMAINEIEKKSQISGLTEHIGKMLGGD